MPRNLPSTECTACENHGARVEPYFMTWKDRKFWLYRCPRCTHQFIHPPVTPEDQAEIYGDEYFTSGGDWACGMFTKGYEESTDELSSEAAEVLEWIPGKSGRLLDIGCAGGVFLHAAQARGFDVQGIEFNEKMAEYARATYGVEVVNQAIETIDSDAWVEPFDVITMLDVLEHIPAPLATIRKARSWLRTGGHLFIRGPVMNKRVGRLKEVVRRTLWLEKHLDGYPLDANAFNKRSQTAMVEKAGFRVAEWWIVDDFGHMLAVAV